MAYKNTRVAISRSRHRCLSLSLGRDNGVLFYTFLVLKRYLSRRIIPELIETSKGCVARDYSDLFSFNYGDSNKTPNRDGNKSDNDRGYSFRFLLELRRSHICVKRDISLILIPSNPSLRLSKNIIERFFFSRHTMYLRK